MSNRFQKTEKKSSRILTLFLPLAGFAVIIVLILAGIRSLEQTTASRELESLEAAIRKSSVQCYALEGAYPESLSYLEEHYGITYDSSRFVVSYQPYASNMMPVIRVMQRKNR